MLPDRVSNPGPLTYKSGALPKQSYLSYRFYTPESERFIFFSVLPLGGDIEVCADRTIQYYNQLL